jgi:hypothetical protein
VQLSLKRIVFSIFIIFISQQIEIYIYIVIIFLGTIGDIASILKKNYSFIQALISLIRY